ncbi:MULTISPECIES: hypothetical protein [unclassified Idiomarina]|jgi:hypothetical protein|uniref:hypothetical protein n=1 Tax=unclassified Idiomarina TaxID=2614829 RepID=UPI00257A4A3D|nr:MULTISPECIES: hypothetical protein [unclassified Idiomarina]|tara:strand:+ start:8670 stop:9230 length:561 start_codon:yes stop_codon:yes gene_type:complete
MKFTNLIIAAFVVAFVVSPANSAELKRYDSIRAMISDKNDYSQENGTFKVLDFGTPPTIQFSTQIFPGDLPDVIRASTRRDILYGVYKTFLHTPYEEIVVVGVPVKFKSKSYVTKYREQIRITKSAATEIAKKMLGANTLRDLVEEKDYGGYVIHTWSNLMDKALYNDQGAPGQDAFFKALKSAAK